MCFHCHDPSLVPLAREPAMSRPPHGREAIPPTGPERGILSAGSSEAREALEISSARAGGNLLKNKLHVSTRSALSWRRRGLAILVIAFLPLSLPASGLDSAGESQRVLRICADPNNLPFTNDRLEGFENKIADLVARAMNATVEYTWWPQRRGFIRHTLNAGRGEVVLGVPAGYEMVSTTKPYYRSTYTFVYRKDGELRVNSLDDPVLRQATIGVQMIGDDFMNTPPAHALAARGIIQNIRGYTVYGDYSKESPPSEIIKAVAGGDIDVAIAWGPLAGYFARLQSMPLEVVPVTPQTDRGVLPFEYAISMGVRRGNEALKRELDEILEKKQSEIAAILDEFGIPRVNPPQDKKTHHVKEH